MRTLMLAVLVSCTSLASGAAPGTPVQLVDLGEIHGAALGWIRIAMPLFEQQIGSDIKRYAISVQEAGDVIHVVFHQTPVVRGQRGAAREGPGMEVEISKATGAVTGARIIR
ncbi:hypothetical protein [Massilia sp. S19_KUP03_FR1]|uniref:hypothetical protein n=1 Tax=Massilia sp. S19_KUP03_FR1 TaxID=3025503 RepID=UPI002FCDBA59